MKHRTGVVCLIALLSVLAVCACGRVPVFPCGVYVANSLDQDYILDFEMDGTYTAVLAGERLISDGAYRPAGSAITFAADSSCADEATYEWSREGEILTFEVSGQDRCPDRRAYLQDTIYTCVTCT